MSTKVVTGKVRASYVNLDQPRQQKNADGSPNGKPKYSVTLLIPKSDTTTLKALKAAQEAAITAKWGDKRPKVLATTVHDGDGDRPSSGDAFGPECEGCYVVTVSSVNKPGIVDQKVKPFLEPGKVVSGDYIRADLNCYAYENSGKKGTSFGLNNVQLVSKGEPLGNVSRPEDAFGALESEEAEEDLSF